MFRYRVETNRSVLPDQRPEDPLTGGKRPDAAHLFPREPLMEKLGQHAVLADYSERGVSGTRSCLGLGN